MKTKWILYAGIFSLIGICSNAQDSLQIQPQPAMPQGQYGTPRIGDNDQDQKEDRVLVDRSSIPPAMQNVLKNEKYKGWENSAIYYEKNAEQYLLHLIKENSTETYRFDKKGHPLFREDPAMKAGESH